MWRNIKRKLWQWRGVFIAAPSAGALVFILRLSGLLQMLELAALDQMFLLRSSEPIDPRIVIVEINESDVQKLGKRGYWPLPDGLLAQVLEKLKQQKPSAIGLDLYRDLPVGFGHQSLVKVFESTPNLVGVQKVAQSEDSSAVAPPPALKKLGQVGANDFPLDGDGKIRRSLMYLADQNGENVFSFSFKLAYLYLSDRKIDVGQTEDYLVKTGNVIYPLFQGNDGGYVRAEDQGYQILINYRGFRDKFQHISIMDVLENRISKNLLKGRIVLIGPTAESLKDLFYTPYSSTILTAPKRMSGVAIHANAISQILSATLDNRSLIKTWRKLQEWLWISVWSLIGAILRWQQRYSSGSKRKSLLPLISILLAGCCLIGSSYLAFIAGWWIPVVPSLIALIVSALAVTAYIAMTAGEIRKTFGRYLTDEVVANLLENPEGLKLGGERKKITILTSDLRGFTATAERLSAEEVIKIINFYLGYMADVITQYHGTIDEFMGDGILVLFGAPISREDDAMRAIACAVAMQLAMEPVNQKIQQMGLPKLEMGIGINTAEVVVGNIGSEKRTKYGIIGNQVNLTYRIESYTVGGQIFISESTIKEAGSIIKLIGHKEVQAKGVKEPIKIYEVGGIAGEYNLYLAKDEEEVFLELLEAIPLKYAVLDGKDVNSTVIEGKLVKLSAKEAQVCYDSKVNSLVLQPFTNLKLNLFMQGNAKISEDIYAKVLDKTAEPNNFYIRFTNLPLEVVGQFNAIRLHQKTIVPLTPDE
ncbi:MULTISPECIES: CHASE2 domain-containing protein [unclassified Nostoc]|uniref:CHASE2 domain-containing protein n=1 Tax=unclassified Nostoc TaxID=2593658 RepID=UPI000B950DDB|nr:adenylate/guanylate cyclase domain-containing protein [Nostoc sp. 'Peltigera membranacea cyanobiont' 232]OYE04000.1 adenylate/guanylate cyclase domain-containing protein [Nostoc sp. 'Peltigera membranacea cyanobiont' 232]